MKSKFTKRQKDCYFPNISIRSVHTLSTKTDLTRPIIGVKGESDGLLESREKVTVSSLDRSSS